MQATGVSLESQVAVLRAELGTELMASLSPAERGELASINPSLGRLQVSPHHRLESLATDHPPKSTNLLIHHHRDVENQGRPHRASLHKANRQFSH